MDSSLTQKDVSPRAASSLVRSSPQLARLLGKAIFFALLALIAWVAVPYGTVEPWWQSLFECAVFGLAALWLIEGFLSGSYDCSAYRILLPLVALALFGLMQTIPTGAEGDLSLRTGAKVWQTLSADGPSDAAMARKPSTWSWSNSSSTLAGTSSATRMIGASAGGGAMPLI